MSKNHAQAAPVAAGLPPPTTTVRSSTRANYGLALLSSLLLYSAAPGQWSLPFLAWIALIPLLIACRRQSLRAAAKTGFFCGLIYHLLLMYWIVIVLGRYGGLPLWLSAPALLALAAYMALYTGAFALIISSTGRQRAESAVWVAPLAWVALDLVRSRLFSGLPWQDLGYSQYQYTFILQLADLTGHGGLTFLIVLTNSTVAWLFSSRRLAHHTAAPARSKVIIPFAALMLSACLYCWWRYGQIESALPQAPVAAIGVIQGNFDQSEKWASGTQKKTVVRYTDLSETILKAQHADLIIWPETALPFFPIGHPFFDEVQQFVSTQKTHLITGAPHYMTPPQETNLHYFNSAFCLKPEPNDAPLRYDKMHLVPFGEYIPFRQFLPEAMPLVQTMGNFTAGRSEAPLPCGDAIKAGVLICYESIFPDLARHRTAQGANLLVNLTNDAWYGMSSAPWQQLSMAVLRAVENRRSLARAANTGISCLIDPLGRITASSPLFEEYSQLRPLPLLEITPPFVLFGYIFPSLCLILLSVLLLYGIYGPSAGQRSRRYK